jgi:outer membrane autotransporter protein
MTNNNKKLLKGLLAGASALTVVMGSATVATAGAVVKVGNANINSSALVRAGNNGSPLGNWGSQSVGKADDWIEFDNAGKTLTINQANAVIQGVDTNKGGSIVIGATSVSIGSIYDYTANNNGDVTINVGANNTLTLTGLAFDSGNDNDYTNLTTVTLGAGSALNIASAGAVVVNPTIDGAAAGNGALSISAKNGDVTVSNDVGANFSLASVAVDATANAVTFDATTTASGNIVVSDATNLVTFTGATKAASLNVGAGALGVLLTAGHTGAASFTGNGLITVANTQNITGAVTTTAPNQGTLNFEQNNDITSQIGDATNGLLAVNLSNGAAGATNIKAAVFAQNVNIGNNAKAVVNLGSAGAGQTITGNLNAGGAGGTLNVFGKSEITGTVGAKNALTKIVFGENGAKLTVGGKSIASPISFDNEGTLVLNVSDSNDRVITGAITTATDNKGEISATGNLTSRNVTFNNAVGTQAEGLASVNVGTANLTISTDLFAHSVTAGSINFKGGNVGIGYADGGKITIDGDVNFLIGKGLATSLGKLNTFTINTANTTVFNDGVNFSSANFVNNAGAGNGTMTFKGNHTVTDALGAKAAPLAAVNVNGKAGTTATFSGDIFANNLQFGDNGTAELSGNVSGMIKSVNNNNPQGTVVFKNTNDVTVGGVTALKAVKIAGGNVEFKVTGTPGEVIFDTDSTLKFTGYAGNAGTKFTASKPYQGTVALTVDARVGNDTYGTIAAPLKSIQINGTSFTVDANRVNSAFTTTVAGKGIINYTVDSDNIGAIGTSAAALEAVNLSAGKAFTFTAPVFAENINFTTANNKDVVTVKGALNGAFNFKTTGGVLAVASGGSIGDVTTDAAGAQVTFAGNGAFGKLGTATNALDLVELNGDSGSVVMANGDVYARTTNVGSGAVELGKSVTVTGALNVNGSTINVNTNTMTVNGTTTAKGPITLAVATDGTQEGTGKLILNATNATGATAANTVVTINGSLPADGSRVRILTVNDKVPATSANSDKALAQFNGDATINFSNKFVKGSVAAGELTLSRDLTSLPNLVQDNLGTEAGIKLAKLFVEFTKDLKGDALAITTDIGNALKAGTATGKDVAEALNALAEANKGNVAVARVTTEAGATAVASHLSSLVANVLPSITVSSAEGVGVSAGDEASRNLGAWANAFGGRGTQQSYKDVSGFKSNVQGGIVGFDAAINDSTVIGVAASMARTTAKFKDVKAGDKIKATTYLFAGYGVHDFGNNWLVQGSAMVGSSSVKSTAHRGLGGVLTATGKFDSMTYAAEALGGYRFNMGDTASVTPLAGLRFTRFSDGAYTETGADAWNTKIKDTTRDKVEGVIGARTTMTAEVNGIVITPEFHGSFSYDFKGKAPKVDVRLDGLSGSIASKGSKPSRASWNLGTSVMAKSGMVEYGAGYDATLSNKYVGHQGSLKVRVNF